MRSKLHAFKYEKLEFMTNQVQIFKNRLILILKSSQIFTKNSKNLSPIPELPRMKQVE
jgi:hypothetical protein